jgi:hypothetical protein
MTTSPISAFIDGLASVETGPGCPNIFDHATPEMRSADGTW